MFDNIGGKIKDMAKWIFIIEVILAVITGLAFLFINEAFIFIGLATIVCGPLVAWVLSCMIYGFGQLIENTDNGSNSSPRSVRRSTEKETIYVQTKTPKKDEDGYYHLKNKIAHNRICPICSKTISGSADNCVFCGTKFIFDEELNI